MTTGPAVMPRPGGWCIHYRNPLEHSECDAGIMLGSWRKTAFAKRPCFIRAGQDRSQMAECLKFVAPTPEEVEAWEAKAAAAFQEHFTRHIEQHLAQQDQPE